MRQMKLEILQENLAKGLSNSSRSVSSKPQMPILANVLLSTDNGQLKLATTNLEMGITLWVGARIEKEGSFTVPAKTLNELVTSLRPGKIEMELVDGQLSLKSGKFAAKINGIPAGEWPVKEILSEDKKEEVLEVDAAELVAAINKVAFSVALDESRPVLTGVLLKIENGTATMVATDGFRLSCKSFKVSGSLEDRTIVVPAKALWEVGRIVGEVKNEQKLKIIFLPGQVRFLTGETEIFARLIEGNFPVYERIIPKETAFDVVLDKEEFLRAVKTAGIFARDSANIIKLKLSDNDLEISANAAQVGEDKGDVPVKVEGSVPVGGFSIAFNFRYLLDVLNIADSEQVKISFSGPLAPGVVKIPADPDFLHIIMPVRVQG